MIVSNLLIPVSLVHFNIKAETHLCFELRSRDVGSWHVVPSASLGEAGQWGS